MRFILWPFRIVLSFAKALAWWYLTACIAFAIMLGIISLLEPLGDTIAIGVGVLIIVLAPELIGGWRHRPTETQSPASNSESADQVLALPAAPAAGHALGAREVYRGSLTTLPRE